MKSQDLLFHWLICRTPVFWKTWSFLFSLLLINGCLKADPFVPQHLGSSLRGGVIARWEEHLCREPLNNFFGIPSTSVCSLFFFGRSRKNTVKNLKLVFASGFFCLFISELGWSVVMCCMERWQKPQWTVPCLQTSCQPNFPSRDTCGFQEFCDSLSTRSYLRDAKSKRKHQKVPKKRCKIPRPQVFQCSVFCQLSGRFGPTALAVRCPLWWLETSEMFETL